MVCRDCNLFPGSPVCGSCRAYTRIGSLLRGGQLHLSQEPRVLVLLRGVAGELADLADTNAVPAPRAAAKEEIEPRKEETQPLTSGGDPGAGKACSENRGEGGGEERVKTRLPT